MGNKQFSLVDQYSSTSMPSPTLNTQNEIDNYYDADKHYDARHLGSYSFKLINSSTVYTLGAGSSNTNMYMHNFRNALVGTSPCDDFSSGNKYSTSSSFNSKGWSWTANLIKSRYGACMIGSWTKPSTSLERRWIINPKGIRYQFASGHEGGASDGRVMDIFMIVSKSGTNQLYYIPLLQGGDIKGSKEGDNPSAWMGGYSTTKSVLLKASSSICDYIDRYGPYVLQGFYYGFTVGGGAMTRQQRWRFFNKKIITDHNNWSGKGSSYRQLWPGCSYPLSMAESGYMGLVK